MHIKELTSEEFSNFVNTFDSKSVYQTSEYGYIMNHQNYTTILVGLVDGNKILAASLIMIEKSNGFKYAYAPRGFLIDYKNYPLLEIFTSELKLFLNKKEICAIKLSPMIIKNIYDNKGNIIESNHNFDMIFDYLKNLDFYHYGFNNYFEANKPRFEAILDLNQDYLTLFRQIKKEFRTKIRSSEQRGIRIFKGKEQDLNYLIEQTSKKYPKNETYFQDIYKYFSNSNMIDYYYAKVDTKLYLEISKKRFEQQENINNKLNSMIIKNANNNSTKLLSKKIHSDKKLEYLKKELVKATNLLRDYPEGIVIASALVIRQNDYITLFMDGFNPRFKNLNAKHLLIWKLIEKYSKLGFTKFNLGGVTNINAENKKYEGLNNFKLNFNANVIEYVGDLELVTNNTLYFMYRKSRQLKRMLKK